MANPEISPWNAKNVWKGHFLAWRYRIEFYTGKGRRRKYRRKRGITIANLQSLASDQQDEISSKLYVIWKASVFDIEKLIDERSKEQIILDPNKCNIVQKPVQLRQTYSNEDMAWNCTEWRHWKGSQVDQSDSVVLYNDNDNEGLVFCCDLKWNDLLQANRWQVAFWSLHPSNQLIWTRIIHPYSTVFSVVKRKCFTWKGVSDRG